MMPREQNLRRWLLLPICLLALSGCGRSTSKLDQAKQLLFQDEHERALALCDEIATQTDSPDRFEAILLRGQVHQDTGKYEQALSDFDQAIELKRGSPEGYFYRYSLHMRWANELKEANNGEESADVSRHEHLAALDHFEYTRRSPGYAEAGLHPPQAPTGQVTAPEKSPPSIDNPVADIDHLPSEETEPANPAEESTPLAQTVPPENEADEQASQPAGNAANENPRTAENWLSHQSAARNRITELDLAMDKDLPEPTLPPHDELDGRDLPSVPVPMVTRFDLGQFAPALPPRHAASERNRQTTGIQPQAPHDRSPLETPGTGDARPQPRSFSPFASGPYAQTTGIRSRSGNTRGRFDTGFPHSQQPNFLSPWLSMTRTQQRPATVRKGAKESESQEQDKGPSTPPKPTQVISMALPTEAAPTGITGPASGFLPASPFAPVIPTTGATSFQQSGVR